MPEVIKIMPALLRAPAYAIAIRICFHTPISSLLFGSGLLVSKHNFQASTLISNKISINANKGKYGTEAPNNATYPY